MQGTGGAVELVERSEGGFGVSCSTTLCVLSFRGVASGGPPEAPAAGFFSYGCGAVVSCESSGLFVGLPPAALRERLRRASFRTGVVR